MSERVKSFVGVVVAAVCLVCCGFFVCVDEAHAETTGTLGTCSWVIDDEGVLTISPTNGVSGMLASSGANGPWYSYRESIKKVVVKPGVSTGDNCYRLFYALKNCTEMDIVNLNTSGAKDMQSMFGSCSSLTSLDVTHLDTSNVTDMSYIFMGCMFTSIDLSHFDTSKVVDMQYMFSGCKQLTSLDVTGFDTSNVTNMNNIFTGCSGLTALDVSHFDTSNVTGMRSVFNGCSGLTSLDVSNFDTSNAINMVAMFKECKQLTSLDLSNFDTRNVTDMSYMFQTSSNLTSIDMSSFDTSNVTDMGYMFQDCSNLALLDLRNFDTSNVTNMSHMCQNCSKLTSIDMSSFDTSNVTSFLYMFLSCSKLNRVTLGEDFSFSGKNITTTTYQAILPTPPSPATSGKWILEDKSQPALTPWQLRESYDGSMMAGTYVWDTKPIAVFDSSDGSLKFYNGDTARTFEPTSTQTVYRGWDTATYTQARYIPWYSVRASITSVEVVDESISPVSTAYWFYGCSNMVSCGLRKLNTSNVTTMNSMFYNCSNLISIDLSNFDTSNVTNMGSMFYNCSNITSLDVIGFDTSNVINMSGMFGSCSKLTSLDVSGFNTFNVTTMSAMFSSCSSLTSLDLSNFNTSNVTNMSSMFAICSKLSSVNVSSFNTSNVTIMYQMFQGCSNLTSLDVGSFDTSNVTRMDTMFSNCFKLTSLDLSSFNTSKVTAMHQMFQYCSGLTSLDLSNFDTRDVTEMQNMFNGCSNLASLDVSNFDTSNVTSMGGMFYNCSNLNRVDLSEHFSFKGNNISGTYNHAILPTPPTPATSGKWILEDKSRSALTPEQLRDTYDGSTMAGVWVWDVPSYIIEFDANGGTGEMANVFQHVKDAYTPPTESAFYRKGYVFAGWSMSSDGEAITSIGANTQTADAVVTLYALWADDSGFGKVGTGEFEFDLEAGAKMWFANVPAGTTYKVYEETPNGWVLVDMDKANGMIEPNQEAASTFTNTYNKTKASAVITGKKFVDGVSVDMAGYTFELRDGNNQVVKTCTTAEDGVISFGPILYTAAGEYTYTIREVTGTDDAINYDSHVEDVTVSVISEDGALKTSVAYDDDGVVFNNTHKDGMLRIMKIVQGAIAGEQPDTFSVDVTLKDKQGNPVTEGVSVNKDSGKK